MGGCSYQRQAEQRGLTSTNRNLAGVVHPNALKLHVHILFHFISSPTHSGTGSCIHQGTGFWSNSSTECNVSFLRNSERGTQSKIWIDFCNCVQYVLLHIIAPAAVVCVTFVCSESWCSSKHSRTFRYDALRLVLCGNDAFRKCPTIRCQNVNITSCL